MAPPMVMPSRDWIRSSDATLARFIRAGRRFWTRRGAVRADGSITAAMDRTVQRAVAAAATPDAPTMPKARNRRSGDRPLIVAVSSYPVAPHRSGGQIRAWHLLTALAAEADLNVEIISTRPDGPPVQAARLSDRVTETTVRLSDIHSTAETRLRLLTGHIAITDIGLSCLWPASPELVTRLRDGLGRADAALHVQPYLAPAVEELAGDLPTICDEHNHELGLKSGILPNNEGGRWLMRRVESTERLATSGARLVTATTDADLASICADYGVAATSAAVVPNGVDTSAIEFVTGARRRVAGQELRRRFEIEAAHIAIFVGSGHGPNSDAGRTIVALAPELPDVTFVLAGRHSDALRGRRLPANVRLLGMVSDADLTLLLSGADLALNPIATGGGSNIKLVTYLAAGIPVVSTALGARGIAAREAGIVISELTGQSAAIRRTLDEMDLQRGTAGRDYVVHHCDWAGIGARFTALIREHVLT